MNKEGMRKTVQVGMQIIDFRIYLYTRSSAFADQIHFISIKIDITGEPQLNLFSIFRLKF